MADPIAPRVLALDLSLTATGVAGVSDALWTWKPKSIGTDRLGWFFTLMRTEVHGVDPSPEVVVIEGHAFSSRYSQTHALGELAGVVKLAIHRAGIPLAEVPPKSLKLYAAGQGNATKPDMRMALFQRAGLDLRDDNQVDAWWLRAMALDHYGYPVVDMPAVNRAALDKIVWPELAS